MAGIFDVLSQLSQPQQQGGLSQWLQQAGQTFSGLENQPLEHLSKLAGASQFGAQLYGGAYGGALSNLADPVNQQYKQALIQQANDPMKRLMDLQQLAINQQNSDSALLKYKREADSLANNSALLGGGTFSPPRPATLPGGDAPLNQRNNNPGNLKDPRTGEFRVFSTLEEGALANLADLQAKIAGDSPAMKAKFGEGYTPNLKNLISVWAPSGDGANNPETYADFVSRETGIPVDKPLALEDAARILPAIAKFEGGANYNLPSALATLPIQGQPMTQTNAAVLPSQPQQSALASLPPQIDFTAQDEALDGLKQVARNNPTNENTSNYFEAKSKLASEKAKAFKDAKELADKEAEKLKKEAGKMGQQATAAKTVVKKVDQALKLVEKPRTSGVAGQLSSNFGGTNAFNLEKELNTIKANLSFDALQKMRDNSPTGGALGQVTEQELALLSSTVANLEVGQSDEQLKRNLQEVKTQYNDMLKKMGYNTDAPKSGGWSIEKVQ